MSLLTPTSTSIPLHAEIPSMDESMAEIEQKQPKKKKRKKTSNYDDDWEEYVGIGG